MRKVRLTESELIKFITQIIKESSHEFQNYEDTILDKISSEGIESLSDIEKRILQSVSSEDFDTKPIMLMLAKKIAKQESLTDIEQMFYDEYSEEPEEDGRTADYERQLDPGVIYDAGDDEVPPSDDRDNRFSFEDPKGEIPTMTFDAMKIYTTDKYIVFQGPLEIEYTTYYGKIYTDLDGKYLGYRFKSESGTKPDEDYESDIIEVFLKLASEQLNQDNEQDEY
jgi:hypothetical protein